MIKKNLDGRIDARQRRWRGVSRIISGSLGVAAIGGAVYLGATGPLVSPVQLPVAPAVVASAPTVVDGDQFVAGTGARQDGRRADRGADFDRGRR